MAMSRITVVNPVTGVAVEVDETSPLASRWKKVVPAKKATVKAEAPAKDGARK